MEEEKPGLSLFIYFLSAKHSSLPVQYLKEEMFNTVFHLYFILACCLMYHSAKWCSSADVVAEFHNLYCTSKVHRRGFLIHNGVEM